ncbi:MAG: hypothetical protein WBL61_16265 [Bryobacteraceae bacterium]
MHLVHAGGGYDKTLAIAGNVVPNEDKVDLLFKNVPKTAHYSLTYISGDGHEWPIFTNVPFSQLQDYSPPAQPPPPASNN